MFALFEAIDNDIANAYWESNLQNHQNKPVESSSSYNVEMFLRDKYERQLWKGSGPDPITRAMSPKAPVVEMKKEEKVSVPKPASTIDLLNDTPLIQTKQIIHSGAKSVNIPKTSSKEQATFNAFPEFPSVSPQYAPQYVPQPPPPQVLPQAAPQFVQAFVHPPQNSLPSNPQLSANPNLSYPQNNYPHNNNIGYPQNNYPPQHVIDAEKNMKINQVLSMYAPQQAPLPTVSQGFKPLGAIAAQNFFNQNNSRAPYPTF